MHAAEGLPCIRERYSKHGSNVCRREELHGVLPLQHTECCSNLHSPVYEEKKAIDLGYNIIPIVKLLTTQATSPNFSGQRFHDQDPAEVVRHGGDRTSITPIDTTIIA